jgi:hypothetical protein
MATQKDNVLIGLRSFCKVYSDHKLPVKVVNEAIQLIETLDKELRLAKELLDKKETEISTLDELFTEIRAVIGNKDRLIADYLQERARISELLDKAKIPCDNNQHGPIISFRSYTLSERVEIITTGGISKTGTDLLRKNGLYLNLVWVH